MITVLDPKKISDPEIEMMLMAFYSRSSKPIKERLDSLGSNEESIKESLKKYYLGYGHKSIGDCGSASVFIEGVSMLAAKALESSPLFNGQETSSRYINFSQTKIKDPLYCKEILNDWMEIYDSLQEPISYWLQEKFPIQSTQSDSTYKSAISAKTFDITRCYLPAGIETQLGLKMTFSSLNDLLEKLNYHPLNEVRNISVEILGNLINQFPSSFQKFNHSSEKANFLEKTAEKEFYLQGTPPWSQGLDVCNDVNSLLFDYEYSVLTAKRPKGTMLPSYLNKYGTLTIKYDLDFGSWRDIQRHRNTLSNRCSPLFHTGAFNKQYLQVLPKSLKEPTWDKLYSIYDKLHLLKQKIEPSQKYDLQYYHPLGSVVNAELVLTVPELFYILELRSSPSVHFTLRNQIHSIWNELKDTDFNLVYNHINEEESEFFYNRGLQTITKESKECQAQHFS